MLNKIWKDITISVNTKLRMFNSKIKSVPYYVCKTGKTNSELYCCIKKLHTFINGYQRKIAMIPWKERLRNEVDWERT